MKRILQKSVFLAVVLLCSGGFLFSMNAVKTMQPATATYQMEREINSTEPDFKIIVDAIKGGANANLTNRLGMTALYMAISYRNSDAVEKLLVLPEVEKNAVCCGLMTPLMAAVESGNFTILKQLLGAQANPNVSPEDGLTPLHIAAHKGFASFVQALVDAGANLNALYIDCKTPLDCALSATPRHEYVANQLRSAGGKEFKELKATASEALPSEAASATE